MNSGDLLLNGRYTGPAGLVMSSDSALQSGNFWSSLENSQFNAWYVNFGTGNANNNNRFNEYSARAVAALSEEIKEGWLRAFEECCSHKMTSEQCILYRLWMEEDLMTLATQVENRTYKPSTSKTFVTPRPKLREIFAAFFRDRIAQTWVCMRLIPLFEKRFRRMGDVTYNSRKGFGVLSCVQRIEQDIIEVSENYTREAWIGKLDIYSCFMSIDRNRMLELLIPFIERKYHGPDKDSLLWLSRTIVLHSPQDDCVKAGLQHLWEKLPPHKSLFNAPPGIGMPIGNITSQILNAFYLSYLDDLVLQLTARCGGRYVRFVDDMTIICRTKADVIHIKTMIDVFLRDFLHHELHPKKFYLQPATHGIKVVGSVIKPFRRYISNTTLGNLRDNFVKLEKVCRNIIEGGFTPHRALKAESLVAGINSTYGSLRHYSSFNVKRNVLAGLDYFWKICYVLNNHTIKIRKRYRLTTTLIQEENEYIRESSVHTGLQQVSSARHHRQRRRKRRRHKIHSPCSGTSAV